MQYTTPFFALVRSLDVDSLDIHAAYAKIVGVSLGDSVNPCSANVCKMNSPQMHDQHL
jgi:hypothetical protein